MAHVSPVLAATANQAQDVCLSTSDAPVVGHPCWTVLEGADGPQYPFGALGSPVTDSGPCSIDPTSPNLPQNCWLTVTSMAFRSWNYGLAATADEDPLDGPAAYGVWIYNGTRWYPNPTFPGAANCPGGTILWAGKLDYWLIGEGHNGTTPSAPSTACRFDGASDEWEVFPKEPFYAGACYAYSSCWFFGAGGAVTRWDGTALVPVTTGLAGPTAAGGVSPSPWLTGQVTGALASTDANGSPFAVAVSSQPDALDPASGQPLQPDGAPAPQIFAGSGGAFSPASGGAVLPSTNLVAVGFDATGDGWVAGNPYGPETPGSPTLAFPDPDQPATTTWLSPLTTAGTVLPCPATSTSFPYSPSGRGTSYLWTSLAVLPGGTALIGGEVGGREQGLQSALAQVSCTSAPQVTVFQIPAPAYATSGTATIAADGNGAITAVAASASNDAWAASSPGEFNTDLGGSGDAQQPPALYQFTDGQTPNAPAGNSIESRPVTTGTEPTIFEFPPPVVVPAPPAAITVTKTSKATKVVKREPAAIYGLQKPEEGKLVDGFVTLSVSFRVRRKVRIGLEALRAHRVVASSGVKTFSGRRGTLALRLSTKAWPTSLKFIVPRRQP